jgi:hypothetical protein
MSLPPVPVFDMSCLRLVEVDRHDARRLIAEHRAGAVHPVAGDVLPILWWALALDPAANMLTLRGPGGVVRRRADMAAGIGDSAVVHDLRSGSAALRGQGAPVAAAAAVGGLVCGRRGGLVPAPHDAPGAPRRGR